MGFEENQVPIESERVEDTEKAETMAYAASGLRGSIALLKHIPAETSEREAELRSQEQTSEHYADISERLAGIAFELTEKIGHQLTEEDLATIESICKKYE